MIKMMIIGNLTRDPEMRTTQSGAEVCGFTVASTRKVNGEDKTDFVKVSVFGKRAKPCSLYLEKGRKVYVCGIPSARAYTNRNGENVAEMQIIADEIEFLSRQGEAPLQSAPAHEDQRPAELQEVDDDEDSLPF